MTKSAEAKSRLAKWLVLEAGLPIFFTAGIYGWTWFGLKLPYPFEQIFASADLLPISAALLLAAFVDFEELPGAREWQKTSWRYSILGYAIILLVLYGVCKKEYLEYAFPTQAPISPVIVRIAKMAIITTCLAMILSVVSKIVAIYTHSKEEAQPKTY